MSRQKRQTKTARAKKKARVVQRKAKGVKGPVLSHRSSGHREAESFTVRPEESNSMEQELSVVN